MQCSEIYSKEINEEKVTQLPHPTPSHFPQQDIAESQFADRTQDPQHVAPSSISHPRLPQPPFI